ncbi:hypothetical protein Dimus_024929, partial [Dionaea muscipula]
VPLVIKKGEEPKKYDFFEDTFLTMCKLTRENGIWWIGSGENRRRDDDEATPEEEAEGEDEGNRVDFGWEAIIDEATVEGESGSGRSSMMLEEDAQGSPKLLDEIPARCYTRFDSTEGQGHSGVDPSGPTSREVDFTKFRASLNERGLTNFMMNWRRPKRENAKLLALLHQAQTKPHP